MKFLLLTATLLLMASPTFSQIQTQGHRGARGLAPENTLPAFYKALELGVDVLELDVIISKDGKVVVSHEPWLNPVICLDAEGNSIEPKDRSHNLYEMTYEEISKCDCGSTPHPDYPMQENKPATKPLLSEVISESIKRNPEIKFNIEVKSGESSSGTSHPHPEEYVQIVHEAISDLPLNQYNIQSFDPRILVEWRKAYPETELAYLIGNLKSWEKNLEELGFNPHIYSPNYRLMNSEKVAAMQAKGIKVIVWTVNERSDMEKAIGWGVDGIITDYPNVLIDLLKSK